MFLLEYFAILFLSLMGYFLRGGGGGYFLQPNYFDLHFLNNNFVWIRSLVSIPVHFVEETPLWEQHLLSVLPFLCRFFPARCRWLMLLQVPSSHVTHFRFRSCCWSCELSSSKSRSVFFNLVGLLLGLRLSEFGLFLYPIIIRSL